MDDAARTLGLTPARRRCGACTCRCCARSLLTAALLVFVDVMKELPATLVMRPFNFDTLAVQAYNLASDERLAEAATAALTIVAVGLVPMIVLCGRCKVRHGRPASHPGEAGTTVRGPLVHASRATSTQRQPARSKIFCAQRWFAELPDRQRVGLEVAERRERGVVDLHALHHRPFVVAVGEVGLRRVARQVLEELDRRVAVRRGLQHAGARDVHVRAEALLVRPDDGRAPASTFLSSGFFERIRRTK